MKKLFFKMTGFFFILLMGFAAYILFSIHEQTQNLDELLFDYQFNSQVYFLANLFFSISLILYANSICLRQVLTGWEKTKIVGVSYTHFIFFCLVEWVLFSAAFTKAKTDITGQIFRTPVEELLGLYLGIVATIVYVLNEAWLNARNKRVMEFLEKRKKSGPL